MEIKRRAMDSLVDDIEIITAKLGSDVKAVATALAELKLLN
ncbi:hypothetical protein [Orenia metallireducens]|nr:hypothetical protein [Orenia metallireducens]